MGSESSDPRYASYPRGPAKGTPDQLEALAEGYYSLSKVCLVSAVIFLLELILLGLIDPTFLIVGVVYALTAFIVTWLSLDGCTKLAKGFGEPASNAIAAAILLGIATPLFVGFFQFAVTLQKAVAEIEAYGVRKRFLSLVRRVDIAEVVDKMRAATNGRFDGPPVPNTGPTT